MADVSQTFSESWHRVAHQRVSLRRDVRIRRQTFRGEKWIVLENPLSNQFFRIRPATYQFVARLNPAWTVEEVWKECLRLFPAEAPGQEAVIQLLAQLHRAGLLHYDATNDTAGLFRRRERQQRQDRKNTLLNIMFYRFPLFDPDRFLRRTLPLVEWIISPIGAAIWMLVLLSGVKIVVDHHLEVWDQREGILAPSNLPLLYLGMVLLKACHELGHAYFCRKFGGAVHVIGIMLMIFTPVPYVDASSSWSFASRRHRILVAAAGVIVELFIAGIASLVWAVTGPGIVHALAYNMMWIASVSTILFNLNPLLRFDGYYILSDLIGIPNLSQRASAQCRHLLERYAFGVVHSRSVASTPAEARWLVIYGVAAGINRLFISVAIVFSVGQRFLVVGAILAMGCAVAWLVLPVGRFIHYLIFNPGLERNRARAIGIVALVAVSSMIFLGFIPVPRRLMAPGVVMSRNTSEIFATAPGFVHEVRAVSGHSVALGDPLIILTNRPLFVELELADATVTQIRAKLLQAQNEDLPSVRSLQLQLTAALKVCERLRRDVASLTIRAPHSGLWIYPLADEKGNWVPRGGRLGLLIDPEGFEFHAIVGQEDGDRLFADHPTVGKVRLRGQAGSALPVQGLQIIPGDRHILPSAVLGWAAGGSVRTIARDPEGRQAMEPFFEVRALLPPESSAGVRQGRSGTICFVLPAEPLMTRWLRSLRQLLQQRYQV